MVLLKFSATSQEGYHPERIVQEILDHDVPLPGLEKGWLSCKDRSSSDSGRGQDTSCAVWQKNAQKEKDIIPKSMLQL